MQFENSVFGEATKSWDLQAIYGDLTKIKQVTTNKQIKLTLLEKTALCGLLCGYSPKKIANKLNWTASALSVELSRGLYRYIESLTNHEVNSIKNWREIAEWLEESGYKTDCSSQVQEEESEFLGFYGREEELKKLAGWIVDDRSRLTILLGMAGIGKTSLALKLVQNNQTKFDVILWRNLGSTPLLAELLSNLLAVFHRDRKQKMSSAITVNEQIFELMNYLRQYRCLIVLDSFQEILATSELAGFYQEKYHDYNQFIKHLVEEDHQSCLLIISQEALADISLLQVDKVNSFKLDNLGKAAEKIFLEKKLSDRKCWQNLIDIYHGNPLALRLVAGTIEELFGGSVSKFLETETELDAFIPTVFQRLFDRQFERLADLEKEIMFVLAFSHQPMTLEQLQKHFKPIMSSSSLLQALNSLRRRSFLEVNYIKYKIGFSIQPMLSKHICKEYRHQYTELSSPFQLQADLEK